MCAISKFISAVLPRPFNKQNLPEKSKVFLAVSFDLTLPGLEQIPTVLLSTTGPVILARHVHHHSVLIYTGWVWIDSASFRSVDYFGLETTTLMGFLASTT